MTVENFEKEIVRLVKIKDVATLSKIKENLTKTEDSERLAVLERHVAPTQTKKSKNSKDVKN